MALPAGLSPATTTFEASYSDTLNYGSVEIGGPPRIRTVFSPVKSRDFTAKVCSPKAFCGMEILSNYHWRWDQTDSRVQRLGRHQPGAFYADNEHASNG